jgi:hypothetical protein
MRCTRIVAALLALITMSSPGLARAVGAQPMPGVSQQPPGVPPPEESAATPLRVSYVHGEVSFWRQGASDWAPAQLNTPLAPGDVLYTGPGGAVEIQVARAAFVRAGNDTQIGLDNQEPDFLQFRVTAGHAGIDLRQVPPGSTLEVDTPQAAFTIQQGGYYRLDVDQDATAFTSYRGGMATMTQPGGAPATIGPNQQVILTGVDSPTIALGAAPPLNAWDNWNYQRSAYLLRPVSARYVSSGIYGAEELDQHGTWRTAEGYGTVWVPSGVPAGWQPYTTGRWIWDPRFGWTWLDAAPWGWAPYHYGRWVYFGTYWGWAPGPVVARPAYAPALVVFLGGVSVGVAARPVYWAPLGWGEPVVPWWGGPGFVGVPWWGGWGGPRVVNNVVVNRNAAVNVTNITVYKNVNVHPAVVGVAADRFGRGPAQVTRVSQAEVKQLRAVHGALHVKPAAVSVMPSTGPAIKPPAALEARRVVATRARKDLTPTLRAHGLTETREARPPDRLVPPPGRVAPREGTGTARMPSPPPGPAGPAPRGMERNQGGARPAPHPSGAAKALPQEMPRPEAKHSGGAAPAQPLPAGPARGPHPPEARGSVQKPGPGEPAPLPGGPHAQGSAGRPGPPPRAEHPKRAEHPSRPAQGEHPDRAKEH